jgi:hypothetical protein
MIQRCVSEREREEEEENREKGKSEKDLAITALTRQETRRFEIDNRQEFR